MIIDIKNIEGSVIISVEADENAISHEELMQSDYIQLSWQSAGNITFPAGSYVEYGTEKYRLLEPYSPSQQDECTYQYTPKFQSRIMNWDKQITPVYTYEDDGVTVKSRDMDWEFTGSPADAMYIVKQAIKNETGEEWTVQLSDSLPATITISSQSASIFSVLNSIASECNTEWWGDKKTNTLYLSKCIYGDPIKLEVGDNVKVPSVASGSDGYYTRFFAFGSTRNIVQDTSQNGAVVNNRLTLDPKKYPGGYKDIREGLKQEEIFVKTLYFDSIYPSSKLTISDVRARLRYRLDNAGNKIKIGGTDEEPVYEQYAIWYFQIAGFTFDPETIIEGKNLSASFESGQLAGRDFELTYHEKAETVSDTNDVTPFEVKAGDYEIIIDETSGQIIPGVAYIIPQEGDSVILYNIEMPAEYTSSAQVELEAELDKEIAKYSDDNNTYQMSSDPTRFYAQGTDIQMGQAVTYVNGEKTLSTRVQMIEKRLDLPCYQTIKVGNKIIKGNTQQLKDEVASVNQNIDVIQAFNELSASLSQAYANAQREMIEGFAAIKNMWLFDEENENTIYSRFNVYSQGWMSAKGIDKGGEGGGGTGGATTLGQLLNVGAWADEVPIYDRIMVQLAGSTHWTEKKLSEIGGGLDEEQLATYLTENNYAKTSDIPSLEGYATETWVTNKGYITSAALTGYATQDWVLSKSYATTSDLDARIDALVNGAPAAYDTLKEIADVLEGNVDSIGDILTTLGTKADKTITITAGTGLTGGGNLSANRTISLEKVGTAGTYTKVTVDAYGRVTSHSSLSESDIPTLSISKISGLQEELDSKLDADVLNDLFEKVEIRSGVYAIRAKYGLYSNEFISAKGMDEGEEGGGSGFSYLSDLLDVSLSGLAANDLLKWNGTKWVNVPMSSIAGASSWDKITGTPTTLSGYGITDAYKVKAGTPDNNKGMCAGYYANVGSYASFVQSNYGGQLSFGAGGVLRYRGINNNAAGEWKTVVDTSVYTASDILTKLKTVDGADSGLDADTLDGYEASKFYANGYVMFGHTIDATNLNENTYYPVTFYLGSSRNVRIECFVSLSSNSKPSWATHQNGFSVKKIWETNGNAWGTINVTRRILASDYLHATSDPVRGIGQMLNSSNEYVYVRGGGRYFFYVSNNITPVLRTSAYTASQETISPTTSAPAEIVRNVAFKTDTVSAADKLTTNAGSNINPIYFTGGVPKESSYVFGNESGNIPISNGTLCTNLNADKLDGIDVTANSSTTGIKKLYVFNYVGNQNTYIKLGTLPTVASTASGTSKVKLRIYGGINFGGREEATWEVIASTRGTIYVNSTLVNGAKQLKIGYVSTSSGVEIWAALDDNYATKTAIEIEVSEQFTVAMTRQTTKPSGFTEGSYRLLLATGTDGILSVNGIKDVERITFAEGDSGRKTVITNGGSFMLYAATSGWAGGVSYYSNDGSTSLGTAAGGYGSGNVLNYYFYGGAYNSPKMVILSSGNVGIGTTAPTQKLHVAGNILATGAITAKAVSDIRLKTVIQEKVDYRKNLLGLGSVVDFYYNDKAIERNTGAVDKQRHIGLIYQQAKASKLVNFCHEDEDGYGSINYLSTDYINLIAGALQQTILKQETIEQRVERLERENAELKQKISKLVA